ncbi:hypothetical protein [Polaromonas sp.]|uniref:VOC family protein n=1 Tax=Polaromonas sp. TaxID=1869339 RepID=UPI0034567D78
MATHALFAYTHVKNAGKAIAFHRSVFGATDKFRLVEPGGRVGHAKLDFGAATLMLLTSSPSTAGKGLRCLHHQWSCCTCM